MVIVECDLSSNSMDTSQVARHLTGLTSFERVTLELDFDGGGEPWPDTVEEFDNERMRAHLNEVLHNQTGILEPTLGAAHTLLDKEIHRLTFFPRKGRLRMQTK